MGVNEHLLRRYIAMALQEVADARVPQQLVTTDSEETENGGRDADEATTDEATTEEADDGLQEFSGCGSVAGYTAPLGMDPDALGRGKNKPTKKKRVS